MPPQLRVSLCSGLSISAMPLGKVAAALLSVAAFAWLGAQPELEWVVLDVVGPASLESDAGSPLEPGRLLTAGRLATGAEPELEVQLGDRLRFRLLPGTDLELPRAPGRWFDRSRRLPLESGEIYGTSGGGALGFDLAFATDELEMRLAGTSAGRHETAGDGGRGDRGGGAAGALGLGFRRSLPDQPIIDPIRLSDEHHLVGRLPLVGKQLGEIGSGRHLPSLLVPPLPRPGMMSWSIVSVGEHVDERALRIEDPNREMLGTGRGQRQCRRRVERVRVDGEGMIS